MESQDLATRWRKASFSNGGGNACVEVSDTATTLLVRDTTNRDGGTLSFTAAAWAEFTGGLKA